MLRVGSETGNMMNHVMSRVKQPEPKVGMGATVLCWTDRFAGTIIKVTRCQVHVQHDKAIRTDKNGMSESQEYRYERDPNGLIDVFRLTKRGYRAQGAGLLIGSREHYHDYSF